MPGTRHSATRNTSRAMAPSGQVCIPRQVARLQALAAPEQRFCPKNCQSNSPCMIPPTTARAAVSRHIERLHGGNVDSVLGFDPGAREEYQKSSRHGLELQISGPLQDGFWVRATAVLAQAAWTRSIGLPVSSVSVRYDGLGYDTYAANGTDGFAQYFEPLPPDPSKFPVRLGCAAASLAWHGFGQYPPDWSGAVAQRMARSAQVVALPLRPQARFKEAANAFWKRNGVTEKDVVLGLHLRGTDKKQCVVPFDRFLPLIRAFLCAHPRAFVFVASDDIDRMVESTKVLMPKVGRRLLWRDDVTRNHGQYNPGVHASFLLAGMRKHNASSLREWERSLAPDKLGEDVLVDTLLLSRSNFLLGTQSAVTEYAHYFNPTLLNHSFTFGIAGHPMPAELRRGGVDAWDKCDADTTNTVVCGPSSAKLCAPLRATGTKQIFVADSARSFGRLGLEFLPDEPVPVQATLGADAEALLEVKSRGCHEVMNIPLHEFGFMSMLHAMLDTVAVSIGMGHRPAIARAHKWSTPAGCGAGVFCWLQPFGYQLDGSEPKCMPPTCSAACARDHLALRVNTSTDLTPMQVIARAGALAARVLRPNEAVSARLHAERRSLSLEGVRFIGVHIRAGDSCSRYQKKLKSRTCDPLSAYMPNITTIAQKYAIRDVFVASDGGSAIFNATRDYPDLRWHFRPVLQEPQVLDIDKLHFKGDRVFPFERGVEAFVDTLLLAEAAAFVGKFTSNLFRAAVELSVGRNKRVPPFASLDAPYCFTGGGEAPILRGPYAGSTFQC